MKKNNGFWWREKCLWVVFTVDDGLKKENRKFKVNYTVLNVIKEKKRKLIMTFDQLEKEKGFGGF